MYMLSNLAVCFTLESSLSFFLFFPEVQSSCVLFSLLVFSKLPVKGCTRLNILMSTVLVFILFSLIVFILFSVIKMFYCNDASGK